MGEDWTGNVTNVSMYPMNLTKTSSKSGKSLRSNHRSSSVGANDFDEGLFINFEHKILFCKSFNFF